VTTTISQTNALALAGQCLRQHGLPNFPDPAVASSGPARGRVILDQQALVAYPVRVVNEVKGASTSIMVLSWQFAPLPVNMGRGLFSCAPRAVPGPVARGLVPALRS
jgi:hypothetical protein